jgi:phosphoserine phosphatase RsbU/P
MDRPYEEITIPFKVGDTLLLYTDGITEARNQSGEMYGLERLRKAIQKAPENVEALGKAVLTDVRRFAGDRPQNDDLTLVCFRCKA